MQKEQNKCFTENSKNILKIYNEYVNEDSFYEAFMELKYSRIGKNIILIGIYWRNMNIIYGKRRVRSQEN